MQVQKHTKEQIYTNTRGQKNRYTDTNQNKYKQKTN